MKHSTTTTANPRKPLAVKNYLLQPKSYCRTLLWIPSAAAFGCNRMRRGLHFCTTFATLQGLIHKILKEKTVNDISIIIKCRFIRTSSEPL